MPADRLTAALADRYRTERELGQGGMATVYLAPDLRHEREVAIKVGEPRRLFSTADYTMNQHLSRLFSRAERPDVPRVPFPTTAFRDRFMNLRYPARTLLLGLLFGAAPLGSAVWGQRAAVPRLPSGKPDFSGIWQALGNAHWDIEPHASRPALAMQPGPVVPVPAAPVRALGAVGSVPPGWGVVVGGEIPYTPAARARRDENRAKWLERDPEIKCYLPGVPRATYMPFPFQIFQSESRFFIAYEYASAVRDIYLRDPGPPNVDAWMGQSVGRWEGDTFIVETKGFNGEAWFDRAGNFHSASLTVVERFTLLGRDHIQYEATMQDPETFTKPWTIRLPLYRHIDPAARLGQFKCVEFVEELLYGHLRKRPIQ